MSADEKNIPTTDYVKSFVEGVEAETARIVKLNLSNIAPNFDTATTYSIGDYCLYNHILYICKNEHTGAWNVSNFEQTNIVDNLSGGGSSYSIDFLTTPTQQDIDEIKNAWGV